MEVNSIKRRQYNVSEAHQITVRACDMCRKKKIRCEPNADTCFQCIKYKTHCHFTPIATSRKPRRPAGHKNVRDLEERLQRMEALLKIAVERGKVDMDVLLQHKNFGSTSTDMDMNVESSAVHDVGLSFTIPPETELRGVERDFLAPLSFPPLQNVSARAEEEDGATIWAPHLSNPRSESSDTWRGSLVQKVFSRRVFRELPSKSSALVLIDEAFKSSHPTFPIFDQRRFRRYFQEHYSESGPSDPGWWACINVVLALAHRFRAMRTLESKSENECACGFMQNALAVVSELTLLPNSLLAIQALLGMTIVLEGTPNPRLCSVLNTTALRLAQTMGLHRKNQDPTLTLDEIEERKNVFWIAYFLDRDISLRTGQPPVQDDDDMDVDLPSGATSDLPKVIKNRSGLDTINFFNARIGLAIIQGQIYKRVYSVKASQQSETEQLLATQELDSMLARWRRSVPVDFDGDFVTTLHPPIDTEVLHVIVLRFIYVNCLITIHRPFPSAIDPLMDTPLGAHISGTNPEGICVIESRKAIRLIQITPYGDYASAWLLIHYFFAAVTALLHHVVLNPAFTHSRSDLELTRPFLQLLEILSSEGKSEEVDRMYQFCIDLDKRARMAVELVVRISNSAKGLAMMDKARGDEESVEDFIRRVECISAGCPEAAARALGLSQNSNFVGKELVDM